MKMPSTMPHRAIALLMSAFACATASADESFWVYAKGAETLPKGELEFKLNSVSRLGKSSGSYTFHDVRPTVEYGITDRLTIEGSVLIFDHNYSVDDPDLQPMFDSQGGEGGRYRHTQIGGYEVFAKYNVLSPYKDAVGLSIGLAYERRQRYRLDGAPVSQNSYVPSLYLQKNFIENTLTLALSTKMEMELRNSPGVREEEIAFDIAAGISYRFRPNWNVGLEFRHQSDYLCPEIDGECDPGEEDSLQTSNFSLPDFRIGSQHQNGNYFGPSLHYSQQHWWATAGVLFQVFGGGSRNAFVESGKNWDEHERVHVGLSFAYEF